MTDARFEPKDLPFWQRAVTALRNELVGVHPRLHVYNLASSLLPGQVPGEMRAQMLRFAGFQLGEGTRVLGPIRITGERGLNERLSIGKNCSVDADCVLEVADKLTIGDGVTIEPGVMILTSTHELDFPSHRAGKLVLNPVVIGDGAWLRARAVILPGVTIGAGAVVEVGAVVNKSVEPNTRVGGSPAAKLASLEAK
jgi:maltose O-acetyltransferase